MDDRETAQVEHPVPQAGEELTEVRPGAERTLTPPEVRAEGEALATLREELHRAHTARREAVHRYRAALLAQSPELPAELVTGETVEEVEAAVQRARELVARVRDRLAMDAVRVVPAGSPLRSPPNLDALSPAEKIRLGLSRR